MLMDRGDRYLVRRMLIAVFTALSLGVLAGCSETTGDEEGASIGDVQDEDAGGDGTMEMSDEEFVFDGPYDSAFLEERSSYEGETVRLSGEIDGIVSDTAFTLAGGDIERLLVVSAEDTSELEPGSSVEVTGTVRAKFELPQVEEDLGSDLDDESFEEWDQEPYLVAESIDTSLDEG